LSEQRSIAAFIRSLDKTVAEVVRTKRRQRELLLQEEAAIVERLVTSGLHPTVPYKATAIEGVPVVPAHWTLSKVKYLARYLNGYAFKPRIGPTKGGRSFGFRTSRIQRQSTIALKVSFQSAT
jgi:hypothetical protein